MIAFIGLVSSILSIYIFLKAQRSVKIGFLVLLVISLIAFLIFNYFSSPSEAISLKKVLDFMKRDSTEKISQSSVKIPIPNTNSLDTGKVEVPYIVGVSSTQAEAILISYGIRIGSRNYVPNKQNGIVLRMLYKNREFNKGFKILKGSRIDLVIGEYDEKQKCKTPNLIGLTYKQAREVLSNNYLVFGETIFGSLVESDQDSLEAIIWKQIPKSGVPVILGSDINIWLTGNASKIIRSDNSKTNTIKNRIKYRIIDKDGFRNKLIAELDGQTYLLIQNENICLNVIDERDYDGNGSIDVLLENIQACGGNSVGNSFFFYSYAGDGHFQRSKEFGNSWGDPIIERHNDKWSVLVTSDNEGFNTDAPAEIKEKYILEDGNAVKVSESNRMKMFALVEMNSYEFDPMTNEEIRSISYDLDGDGIKDKIEGQLWIRWGRICWKVKFSSGKSFVSNDCFKRIGVAKSITNGVHDLIGDLDQILKWDGKKYNEVKHP